MRATFVIAIVLCGCQSPRTVTLGGMVIMSGDSDASGVSVRAVGPTNTSAITDARGNYALPALPPGDYELLFSADDTLEKTQLVHVSVAAAMKVPAVRFTAAGSVAGTITLAGQPGGGATVLVDGASAVATSDGKGSYRLDGVAAGAVTVEAVLAGYQPGSLAGLTVARGRVTQAPPLDLAADGNPPYAAAALSGTALRIDRDDSSGTTVTATLGTTILTTTTAKDGTYHFDGVPTGLYRIDFSYDGHHESIPEVLALGGSTGQIIDGALYPLATNPIRLPVARRLADAGDVDLIDGDRVLLRTAGVDSNHQKAAVLSLTTGTLTPVTDDIQPSAPPQFSADRTHFLYEAGGIDMAGAIRLGAVDGSAPVTLASVEIVLGWGYRFWPGDTRVLFEPTTNQLDSITTAGGTPTLLASGVTQSWPHPDKKRLVYETCAGSNSSSPCSIWTRTVDGGTPVHVMDGAPNSFSYYISLSPDGSHLAVFLGYDTTQQSGQLVIASVDNGAQQTLWNGAVRAGVAFSPDGRWMAFVTDGGDLRLADLTSATPMGTVVAQQTSVPTFTSDGSRFLYAKDVVAQPHFYTLLQQPVGGGTEVTLGTHVSGYVLSPDGKRTLFIDQLDAASGYGRLRVADATGTATTLVASGARGASFSLDGAYAQYQTQDPARADTVLYWSVPSAGGTPAQLSEGYPDNVHDSPGGARVAFYGLDGLVRVVPIGGGKPQVAGEGYVSWATETRVLLDYPNYPPPFSHQSGLYLYEVTP